MLHRMLDEMLEAERDAAEDAVPCTEHWQLHRTLEAAKNVRWRSLRRMLTPTEDAAGDVGRCKRRWTDIQSTL